MAEALKVQMRELSTLHQYEKNARVHSSDQVEELVRSIEQFGIRNPLTIKDNGEIITGHGRFMAATKLGLKVVPTISVGNDFTEEEIKLYRIADNRLAEKSTWNMDLLKLEFDEILQLESIDLSLSGWEPPQIQHLLAEVKEVVEGDATASEWSGMPSFDHKDESAFCTIKVHLRNAEDVQAFASLIQQKIDPTSDRKYTKSLWYPEIEIRRMMNQRYSNIENKDESITT